MTLRLAEHRDMNDLLQLAQQFSSEAPKEYAIDLTKVYNFIMLSIEQDTRATIVLEKDGKVVGFLSAVFQEMLFSNLSFVAEVGWFIHKDYRNFKDAMKMIKALEEWGTLCGAKMAVMADIEGIQNLGKLYERNGYTLFESSYRKEL